jgi:hypothetical protein
MGLAGGVFECVSATPGQRPLDHKGARTLRLLGMTQRNTTTIALKRPSAGRVARFDFPDVRRPSAEPDRIPTRLG